MFNFSDNQFFKILELIILSKPFISMHFLNILYIHIYYIGYQQCQTLSFTLRIQKISNIVTNLEEVMEYKDLYN